MATPTGVSGIAAYATVVIRLQEGALGSYLRPGRPTWHTRASNRTDNALGGSALILLTEELVGIVVLNDSMLATCACELEIIRDNRNAGSFQTSEFISFYR